MLTTLVVQGMTLRPLMQRLGLRDEGHEGIVAREINLARAATARVALRVLSKQRPRSESADLLAAEYRARLHAAESDAPGEGAEDTEDTEDHGASLAALQRRTVGAQREALARLLADHRIGNDAFHAVEAEIALLELTADTRVPPTVEAGPPATSPT